MPGEHDHRGSERPGRQLAQGGESCGGRGTVMKLIPYINEDRPGEVYRREEKRWKRIGIIKPEDKADGFMTPVEE